MTCRWCATDFAARSDAAYCSTKCRVAAHRARPPEEMAAARRWLRHRSKIPITHDNRPAASTHQWSWCSYDKAAASEHGDGLGFALGDGFAAIDLDHCLVDGKLEPWAAPIVKAARGTYMEISISGTGLHIFGFGRLARGVNLGGVEAYSGGRYMTVSLRRFRRAPLVLKDLQPLLNEIVREA